MRSINELEGEIREALVADLIQLETEKVTRQEYIENTLDSIITLVKKEMDTAQELSELKQQIRSLGRQT